MIQPTEADTDRRVVWTDDLAQRREEGVFLRPHRAEGSPGWTAAFVRFDNHPGEIKVSLSDLIWA